MTRLALILALLITPAAWAQTTVDFAIVFGEMMIPTESGPTRRVMPVLRTSYELCDDVETAAQSALREGEVETAAALGYPEWSPQSWALCYKEKIITWNVPANSPDPILCVHHVSDLNEPVNWFAPCP